MAVFWTLEEVVGKSGCGQDPWGVAAVAPVQIVGFGDRGTGDRCQESR